MTRRNLSVLRRVGVLAAVPAVLAASVAFTAAPAAAYQGCSTSGSGSTSVTTVASGGSVSVTFTFTDCNGKAVSGVQAAFASSCGSVSFNPPSGTTNSGGQVTSTATIAGNCCPSATLTATASGTTASTTVQESGCLPNTVAARDVVPNTPPAYLGLLIAFGGLVILSAGALTLIRRRA
jgi:hypothetical protein